MRQIHLTRDPGLATVWAGVSLQFVADHEGGHEPRSQMRNRRHHTAQWAFRQTFIVGAKLRSLVQILGPTCSGVDGS